ncbi:hypothetical protein OJF2_24540 [Aquisphaera giovannonii]|uniref:Uncharacterized protein n=1 Tax=Aquisphaera giovannonii TaxID=406548 RepID=A0A5B9VZX0_9BACT|nr:hypothetical protein [Aquisphaera giovannonii]QEH33922.1 hypothetical protein OJF2_24540 [Aquisphaera giovannonii]
MIQEQTLVRIRERGHLDVLDLTMLVIRRRPREIGLAAAAGIAPFAALNAWLLAGADFPAILWPVLLYFEAPWATAPLTVVLGGLMFGRRPRAREAIGQLARAFPAFFFVHVIYRALRATILLLPFAAGSPWVANQVILLEKAGAATAIRRSARLAGENPSGTLPIALAELAFGLIFAVCFWIGTGAAIETFLRGETTWDRPGLGDLGGLRFQLGIWIAIAFFGAARFFLYIDQRVRSEGWELRLRLWSAGADLERGPR